MILINSIAGSALIFGLHIGTDCMFRKWAYWQSTRWLGRFIFASAG